VGIHSDRRLLKFALFDSLLLLFIIKRAPITPYLMRSLKKLISILNPCSLSNERTCSRKRVKVLKTNESARHFVSVECLPVPDEQRNVRLSGIWVTIQEVSNF